MMNDGNFRPQMPPQGGQLQFQPLQPGVHQIQGAQFQQQMMANVQQPQMAMQSQPYAMAGIPQGPPIGMAPIGQSTGPQTLPQAPAPTGGPQAGAGQLTVDNSQFHPIIRARTLVTDLKLALQTLMKVSADAIKDQAVSESSESTPTIGTGDTDGLHQSVEIFDAICDQIEENFVLVQDMHREQLVGDRFAPVTVTPSGQKEDQPEGAPGRPPMLYKDYEDLIRMQGSHADSVRDSFHEFMASLDSDQSLI